LGLSDKYSLLKFLPPNLPESLSLQRLKSSYICLKPTYLPLQNQDRIFSAIAGTAEALTILSISTTLTTKPVALSTEPDSSTVSSKKIDSPSPAGFEQYEFAPALSSFRKGFIENRICLESLCIFYL
jgi:hypothetical protein